MSVDRALARRRKRVNRIFVAACWGATLVGLMALGAILNSLLGQGLDSLGLNVFLEVTRSPGSGGGLLNAIVGTLIQASIATAIGTPIGLMAGTYLSEYARNSTLGHVTRFVSDMLLSAPSILIGLFAYQLVVLPFGGFSAIAGSIALAIIVIPIVVRTTEDSLRLVPDSMREAATALGAPRWIVVTRVAYRAARDGMLTGLLLAVARISGETAPLIFTSLGNLNWSVRLTEPMASLPITIYQYAGSPFADWVALAWTGALLITIGVLALNVAARLLAARARN